MIRIASAERYCIIPIANLTNVSAGNIKLYEESKTVRKSKYAKKYER